MISFFIKEEHSKHSKILNDAEFDEYVYIVQRGKLGIIKSIDKIKDLKDKLKSNLSEENLKDKRYIILDELNKGDIIGVYSALKHHKNNYSVIVLSEKAYIYKIMKAHILLYFGGYFGPIPEALKGIDCIQQNNFTTKINIIEKLNKEDLILKDLRFVDESQKTFQVQKKTIDESDIFNNLKDAWKELEKLSTKLNDFKSSLMNNNETKEKIDLLEKLKKTESDQRIKLFYLIIFY
jgi:hypothetical protein